MRGLQERRPAPPLTARPLTARPLTRLTGRLVALLGAVAAVVVALDQLTKTWAVRRLADGPIHVVGSLRLNLTYNKGGAFGFGSSFGPFFVIAALVLVLVLAGVGRGITGPLGAVALGMVAGGALGNLADSLFRDTGGAVVDFIDLQWWPVFILADSAIVCGGLLLLFASRERRRLPA